MMLLRLGIYETNSSSTHSIALGKRGKIVNNFSSDTGNSVHIDGFLWEKSRKTNESPIKLSYLLSYISTVIPRTDRSEEFRECLGIIKKVFKTVTGYNLRYNFLYQDVDHDSRDIIDIRDLKNPEFIKEFIFNPDTWCYFTWDHDGEDEVGFFETNPNPILFTFRFDLPGIDDPFMIDVFPSINIDYLLASLFSNVYYNVEDDNFSLGHGDCCYTGDFCFGKKKVIPTIIYRDDTK